MTQVQQIRQLKGIEKSIDTAARYGITESNVRLIQDGKTWRSERKIRRPFTPDQVRHIRRIGYSKSISQLAKMFGASEGCISNVRSGKSFRDIF